MSQICTLSGLLADRAQRAGDACAVIENGQRVSYKELNVLADLAASWLASRGIGAGDRVAVWMVNRVEWLALLFGACRLGAAVVAVNTRYRSAELQHILSGSGAKMLVLQSRFRKIDFLALLAEVDAETVPALETIVVADAGDIPANLLGKPVIPMQWPDTVSAAVVSAAKPDELAMLFTTSGTTKLPKLVMHSQKTLSLHGQNVAAAYGLEQAGASVLAALPFCGVFGLVPVLAALSAGTTVVVMDAFDGTEAVNLIERYGVTHCFGSDEMFHRMLEVDSAPAAFSSLRCCGFASFNASPEQLVKEAESRQLPLVGLYGSSEVQALFSLQSAEKDPGSRVLGGGYPTSPAARVRIRDVDSGELCGFGESGVIEIAAPTNFLGYLNAPEATAEAVDQEGFFKTGDIGYLREDGGFVYQSRQGDAIRLAGFLVNPAEIEDVMCELPGVAEAQVIGVDLAGEPACVAFVIPESGVSLSEAGILSQMESEVAKFKLPRRIWLVERFPVTESANGTKVQRVQLRKMAAERLAES
ncbi:AMP-binding protein [Marinobacter salinexigens]|uniref:Long-chain-fatty-acid--CoA ligase n=1 Tax=Marinobacter salinexigens TaxID=2919747 RepID=A0A5B0VDT7_9GAMM|nr:AMP-binding protein [Marinobacter salinexigens]KAA1172325.1 AMP-binding protein [Marinobacter salinexigens]